MCTFWFPGETACRASWAAEDPQWERQGAASQARGTQFFHHLTFQWNETISTSLLFVVISENCFNNSSHCSYDHSSSAFITSHVRREKTDNILRYFCSLKQTFSLQTLDICVFGSSSQAERIRKEEADAMRKAEDEVKKKIALTNMGSGFSSHLQRVLLFVLAGLVLKVRLKIWLKENFLSFSDRSKTRQKADWERKEEEDSGWAIQTYELWWSQWWQVEVNTNRFLFCILFFNTLHIF